MPCYSPMAAYRTATGEVVFSQLGRYDIVGDIKLPCRQCVGCRLDRAKEWGLRVSHEAQLHKENAWLTLTYDEAHLPPGGTLVYAHFQRFMRDLRRFLKPKPVRFYMCGEYGEQLSRPHYHVCLFGHAFPYDSLWMKGETGSPTYLNADLTKLWRHGLAVTTDLNPRNAAYTARYCMKKITGDLAEGHYETVDSDGVLYRLEPEFNRMSLRPGIGARWLGKYYSDVYPGDYCVSAGSKNAVPGYYDKLLRRDNPEVLETLKYERELKAREHADNNTPERLKVRDLVVKSKIRTLKRNLES